MAGPRMGRYAALLRGINVGRAKRISMTDLWAVMEGLGYRDCRTLLNSGNVAFSAVGSPVARMAADIERAVLDELGVAASVIVLGSGGLSAVIEENRLPRTADDPRRVLVAFVQEAKDLRRLDALRKRSWAPEVLVLGNHAAYLWCPAGTVKGRLWRAVGEALGEDTTTRNWATVRKLAALL
jgi:uncharacterized protein (DUF1697 family)